MKEKQLRLFTFEGDKKSPKRRYAVTLPLDTLILLCIVIGLLLTISFSLGVEKGRKIASLDRMREHPDMGGSRADASVGEEEVPRSVQFQLDVEKEEEHPDVTEPGKEGEEKRYIIQVVSYTKEKHAHKEAERLEEKGYPTLTLKKGDYMVVFVGEFSDKNEAKKNMMSLKQRYGDCFIRTVRGRHEI